jgi:hypothetical protein
MISDQGLAFVPAGAPLSLVGGAGVSFTSNVIDLMGPGVGVNIQNYFGISAAPGQADALGVGDPVPDISVFVGTALATATSATLTIQYQAAPDDGTSTGTPGTWQTIAQTAAYTAAQGAANTELCRLPMLPPVPFNLRPRFLRLNFSIPSGADFTAGTIASALVVATRDDYFSKQQPSNYTAPRYNHP